MSISTILGVLFGFGLVVISIILAKGNLASFGNAPSLLIVVGGTLAAAFMGYQARYVILSLKELPSLFKKPISKFWRKATWPWQRPKPPDRRRRHIGGGLHGLSGAT